MERTGRMRPRSVRLVLTPAAIAILFGGIIAALLLRNLFVAGRRPIGWAIAALVAAAAIEPFVSWLSRYMRRGLALLCVLIPLIAAAGLVARGVYNDLDNSIAKLQTAIPEAADRIEASDRFGEVAKELELSDRAQEVADSLEKPSSNVAGRAAGSGSAWLVTVILTIFALGWGPRFAAGALDQFEDDERRDRVAHIVSDAFSRSQAYVDASLAQGLVVGGLSWLLYRMFDVPAPTPLAVVTGVLSMVPVVGIFVGSLPAVMLVAGFETFGRAGWLLAIAVLAQIAQVILFRSVTHRTVYVGPATVVIAYLIGSKIYGLGGAVFGTAIAVFGMALIEAIATERGPVDLPPEEADPTEPVDRSPAPA